MLMYQGRQDYTETGQTKAMLGQGQFSVRQRRLGQGQISADTGNKYWH